MSAASEEVRVPATSDDERLCGQVRALETAAEGLRALVPRAADAACGSALAQRSEEVRVLCTALAQDADVGARQDALPAGLSAAVPAALPAAVPSAALRCAAVPADALPSSAAFSAAALPCYFDAHCHLGFYADPARAAALLAAQGVGGVCVTVTPSEYERLQVCTLPRFGFACALGLHPWQVGTDAEAEAALARFEQQVRSAPFIGEVGLDFSAKHEGSREAQVAAFRRIVRACVQPGEGALDTASACRRVMSIHAVRSAGTVLDILEEEGAFGRVTCIFHWFSGSSDELARARKAGCLFSVGARMLATKRGRSYAASLPSDRLLIESDLPEG